VKIVKKRYFSTKMQIKYVFTIFTRFESVRSKAEPLARLFMCFGAYFDKN
jgi:hypothetical protein